MKKIIQMGLKLSCGVFGAVIIGVSAMAANSISWFGSHEPKMPTKLLPKDEN